MESKIEAATLLTEQISSARETVSRAKRNLVFGVVNLSHVLNHMESSMVAILYPVMMGELGFGYFAVGVLQTIYQVTAMACQVVYGLVVRFMPRALVLGLGNVFLGAMVMLTGLAQSFAQVATMRALTGLGSSVQHPVGSAILVSYFKEARGRVLTLHHSAGNLGGFLAPAVVGALLLYTDWRAVFCIVGILSVAMGLVYFFLRDTVVASDEGRSTTHKARAGLNDYLSCIRNRNVMLVSLIQMAGAAGRGTGISVAFLTAFFMHQLHVSVTIAAALLMVYQLSGLIGPLAIGWLSDRFNRKLTVQLTLLISTLSTLSLLLHEQLTPWLLLNLVVYGSVIQSRGPLTQSMVTEAVPFEKLDAAFSIYFFIGFISGPLWTFVMGWLIDAYGFAAAFKVISLSYLAGMLILCFARVAPRRTI
ncbi:MAG TPA: MFS transporter [Candidatus Acidoferrales bacterium]|nr:MFS transporter [Candidatus Acidoferrales bacterium]